MPTWIKHLTSRHLICYTNALIYRVLAVKNRFVLYFTGLLSWDVTSCHVDLGKELEIITSVAPPGEECRGGLLLGKSKRAQSLSMYFFRRKADSVCFWPFGHRGPYTSPTQYPTTMYEKHAGKFHQTPTYCQWWLYFCRHWCLGSARWALFIQRLCQVIWGIWHPKGHEGLWE